MYKVEKYLIFALWLMNVVYGARFHQDATSFSSRTDQFISRTKLKEINIGLLSRALPVSNKGPFQVQYGAQINDNYHQNYFLHNGFNLGAITPYPKIIFFSDIPHVRLVLHNQQIRIANGLAPHRLGSLRRSSPWYRVDNFLQF